MKKSLLFVFSFILVSYAFSQNGKIRGTVIEDATGEPLYGVTVVIEGTTNGSTTDFDGKFEISIAPGTYNLQSSFVSFKTVTITDLQVKFGDVTIINQIRLQEDVEELEAVVISAQVANTTEAAMLTVKRKSANLIDGISAASFSKIGDSNAASAVKRVTGVSVEGGKYVYVRGLGDRYTKTMLNSVDIPGLDPDRNSLQIDIFPTNLIDNMVVLKTALAEMPADFTGGIINIETKDFPEDKILDVSLGVTYNPSMHFNKDFLTYEGSKTDWLGFDSDTRTLPSEARGQFPFPTPANAEEVNQLANKFSPTLGASPETSFMDYNLGITYGNQRKLANGNGIGFIFSGSYKSERTFYDDAIFGEYQNALNSDEFELIPANIQTGSIGTKNVLLAGLGGLAYKTSNSKYRFTIQRLQNGESQAAQFRIVDDPESKAVGKSGFIATSDNLVYSQRSLTNALLSGEHHINGDGLRVDWKISPTISKIEDPDIRKAAFSEVGSNLRLASGAAGIPSRIWRYLDESNLVGKVDFTKSAQIFGSDAKYKFGASYVFKERDYEIQQVNLGLPGSQPDWTGDANEILVRENLYPNEGGIFYQSGNASPNPNAYNSTINNTALYTSAEMNPSERLKAIFGLRVENFVQRHTGRDIQFAQQGIGNNLENDKVLDAFDWFPSLNLIYELTENQNLRFSYSRTIARPSFKELSFAQIIDPVSNRIFNGGLFVYEGSWEGKLKETRIDNFDLRWELFQKRGQLVSLSLFYKSFDSPIELVRIPEATTNNEFQPRNVGDGQIRGAELEIRQSLQFISTALAKFSINGNYTLVNSQIDMTGREFAQRSAFEKVGQNVKNTRDMSGQAPYIINAGFQYDDPSKGFDAGFFYNVKGATLIVVGGGVFPDVYSEPFHSLNFNLNKSFGDEGNTEVNLSISNILNDVREEFYTGFEADDQYFTRFSPGVSLGVGFKYSF